MLKKRLAFVLALFLTLIVTSSARAADFLPKNPETSGNVVVSGPFSYRNLYVGGGNVVVNQPILGDLFAGGGSLSVLQPVEKDLFIAGGNLNLVSAIGEDLRAGGGSLTISGPIGGDALLGGGTILINPAATIAGDLWAGGGVINLNGSVGGSAKIGGGEIFINSQINGPVEVWADKLTFGPDSRVSGPIIHHGPNRAVIQTGGVVGPIDFKITKDSRAAITPLAKFLSVFLFIKIVALLLAALLVLRLFRSTSSVIVSRAHQNPWSCLGIGFLSLIAFPLLIILTFLSVIGFYIGLILLFFFLIALFLSGALSVLLTGSLIEKWLLKNKKVDLSWKTALWGIIGGTILAFIPFIGWLMVMILSLISLGSFLRAARDHLELK